MSQPKIDIIFFDIDETLMRKEDGYLPPELPDIMQALKAKGIITAIATGRSLGIIPPSINELRQKGGIEIICAANGQIALRNDEILHNHPLPLADLEQLIALAQQQGWDYLLHGMSRLCVSDKNPKIVSAMYGVDPWFVDPNWYQQEAVHQFGYFISATQAQILPEVLSKLSLSDHYRYTPWHEFGCDLIPSQGSKANGIKHICAQLGIALENVAAFGDGLNDIEMIQSVGLGVAMGNANPALKAVANYITSDIDQQGIANALKHFQLI